MSDYMTLVGAYGRTYRSEKEVLDHWNANKDFRIVSVGPGHRPGSYLNKEEAERLLPGVTFTIRYHARTKFVLVKVPDAKTA